MKVSNKLAHYGDMIAIPFFIITLIYFFNIENKTNLEYLIILFLTIALICDVVFTYIFMISKQ